MADILLERYNVPHNRVFGVSPILGRPVLCRSPRRNGCGEAESRFAWLHKYQSLGAIQEPGVEPGALSVSAALSSRATPNGSARGTSSVGLLPSCDSPPPSSRTVAKRALSLGELKRIMLPPTEASFATSGETCVLGAQAEKSRIPDTRSSSKKRSSHSSGAGRKRCSSSSSSADIEGKANAGGGALGDSAGSPGLSGTIRSSRGDGEPISRQRTIGDLEMPVDAYEIVALTSLSSEQAPATGANSGEAVKKERDTQNPFVEYEDREQRRQQERRWLQEDELYMEKRTQSLHQRWGHSRLMPKTLYLCDESSQALAPFYASQAQGGGAAAREGGGGASAGDARCARTLPRIHRTKSAKQLQAPQAPQQPAPTGKRADRNAPIGCVKSLQTLKTQLTKSWPAQADLAKYTSMAAFQVNPDKKAWLQDQLEHARQEAIIEQKNQEARAAKERQGFLGFLHTPIQAIS